MFRFTASPSWEEAPKFFFFVCIVVALCINSNPLLKTFPSDTLYTIKTAFQSWEHHNDNASASPSEISIKIDNLTRYVTVLNVQESPFKKYWTPAPDRFSITNWPMIHYTRDNSVNEMIAPIEQFRENAIPPMLKVRDYVIAKTNAARFYNEKFIESMRISAAPAMLSLQQMQNNFRIWMKEIRQSINNF